MLLCQKSWQSTPLGKCSSLSSFPVCNGKAKKSTIAHTGKLNILMLTTHVSKSGICTELFYCRGNVQHLLPAPVKMEHFPCLESQNGLGSKGPQWSSSFNPLLYAGSTTSRPGCPEPHPAFVAFWSCTSAVIWISRNYTLFCPEMEFRHNKHLLLMFLLKEIKYLQTFWTTYPISNLTFIASSSLKSTLHLPVHVHFHF